MIPNFQKKQGNEVIRIREEKEKRDERTVQ
jgi:hypothetical protein